MADSNLITPLLSGVSDSVLGGISAGLPIAGPIFAAIAGLMIGFKIFKKVTGARA